MCGLIAASGPTINPRIVQALGCFSSDRGRDSAGIGWQEGGMIKNHKMTGDPICLFAIQLADSIIQASQAGILIGHTRAATHGSVTNKNAHPFMVDGILFAHNGVISNYRTFGEYEVDSQCLIHGIKKLDFSEFMGSIGLVWIKNNSLFAFRQGNPLYRGMKDGTMYLASDDDYLKNVGCERIRQLAEGRVYEIKDARIKESRKVPTQAAAYKYVTQKWSQTPAVEKPQPDKDMFCVCGHKGFDHNKVMVTTGEWACYGEMAGAGICPCSEFREGVTQRHLGQIGYTPEEISDEEICGCGHEFEYHKKNENNRCEVTFCACEFYRHPRGELTFY